MDDVPCSLERTAATGLLLLSSSSSSTPNPLSSTNSSSFSCFDQFFSKQDSSPSDSWSCSSCLTSEGCSEGIGARQLRILAVAARCHEMKLKVVRRSRSKNHRNSDRQKNISSVWRKPVKISPAPASESTETSLLSCGSSSVTSAARWHRIKFARNNSSESRRENTCSAYMRRRAEAILKFLSVGCASEVRIREVLGDSPDTSKALRMLLKLEEVKRSGAGGRTDPYMYTIAQSHLE